MLVEEDYEGNGFEDEIDHDSIVSDRKYGGRLREVRNREDNNLMRIPSFQGNDDP